MGRRGNAFMAPLILILTLLLHPAASQLGAPSTIATDDADMLSALSAGMSLLNQQSNSLYLHMPVRVVQASRQVVSGMKYTIQIEMGESSCLKDFAGELTLDACPVSGSTQRYELSIWDQPWMDPRYQLTGHRAIAESSLPVDPPQDQPSPSPPLVGAPSTIATDDADMLSALSAGMSLLNQQSNSLYLHMPVRVVQASRQVVSGMKYTIQIEMGESSCLKASTAMFVATPETCPTGNTTEIREFDILWQAWAEPPYTLLGHRSITPEAPVQEEPCLMVDCFFGTTLVGADTRGCGGQCEPDAGTPEVTDTSEKLDVSDPDVLSALQAGMKLLNQQSHSKNLIAVVRLIEASRQMAEGIRYTLIVEWGVTQCKNDAQARHIQECTVHGESHITKLLVQDKPSEEENERYSLESSPVLAGISVDCPMFKCANTECRAYAKLSNGCQDGCKCEEQSSTQEMATLPDSDDPDDSDDSDDDEDEEDAYKAEAMVYGILTGVAAFAVLAVPAAAYYGYRHRVHQANRDATVTVSEESAQLSSPTARRIEEGIKADIGPAYTQVPKAASDQL